MLDDVIAGIFAGALMLVAAGLLIWRHLKHVSKASKVAAYGLLLFGVFYFIVLALPYISVLGQADVEGAVYLSTLPLLVSCVALFLRFREQAR